MRLIEIFHIVDLFPHDILFINCSSLIVSLCSGAHWLCVVFPVSYMCFNELSCCSGCSCGVMQQSLIGKAVSL